jgi:hypothetical protein
MATLAVFIALGGTAVASVIIASNSQVAGGTISGHKPPSGDHANIIGGSLNAQDLAAGAVTGTKLARAPFHSSGLVDDAAGMCSSVVNQWASVGIGTVDYYRDLDGRVYLRGLAERCGSPASGNTIFRLPAGFRPEQPALFGVLRSSDGTLADLSIDTAGHVRPTTSAADQIFSLDGVSFRCGPSRQNGCP